ncbi:MAG TPA: NIPSNAP family protein [Gemmatimonadaceae bacterium]
MSTPSERVAATSCCPVVELRRYTLHPGARETLIALFDRELIEPQEAAGMQVIAQFRDIDQPDVFTWLRGFADMTVRAAALAAFYDGPVWRAHRDAANATMIDSDDVRLLRPARPGSGFAFDGVDRPGPNARSIPPGLFVVTIYTLDAPAAQGFTDVFEHTIAPALRASGASPLAVLETEPSANTFPRLPVREGEHAFVWFARFADVEARDRHRSALEKSPRWREAARPALDRHLLAPEERWRLTPTARLRPLLARG